MDFTFTGDGGTYDDSSVISWLRRIYSRLGNSSPSPSAPSILEPDPEAPFDFWGWLMSLLTDVIGGILGGATDAVSTLLNGIRDKFPMSIPWDVMALLALLDGQRVTPEFDVTIPAVQGWWPAVIYHIDLEQYDNAAATCRSMVLLWWGMVLLMKTKWMIDDVLGGVAKTVTSGFVDRLSKG